MLDFPNVASKARAQTTVVGPLVTRVRVAVNSREPLVTRVVMEVADGATYHVERAGADGRDLAVVFGPAQSAATFALPTGAPGAAPVEQEPDIPLAQAIANAAAITPRETPPADPIAALRTAPLRGSPAASAPARRPPVAAAPVAAALAAAAPAAPAR